MKHREAGCACQRRRAAGSIAAASKQRRHGTAPQGERALHQRPPALHHKVVLVARRGVTSLLAEAITHLKR